MALERHALHFVVDASTTDAELELCMDVVSGWGLETCLAATPLENDRTSICLRHGGHSGRCGGLMFSTGIEQSL